MRAWNGGRETHWVAGCCFSLYLKPCFQVSQVGPWQLRSPWGCKDGAPPEVARCAMVGKLASEKPGHFARGLGETWMMKDVGEELRIP